jgi:DNA-binding SARP family transcriptional activator
VSRLRRAIAGADGVAIVTRGGGYELRLSEDAVDAVRFERLVTQRRSREALALWRGEPLGDVVHAPFAAVEARRLDDLRLQAFEQALDDDLAGGRHAEALGELELLVAEHPLHERLQAQRMLALYRAGRQAEALEAYRDARAALVEGLGVEPCPEMRELHAAILHQDAALAAPPRAGGRPPAAAPAPRARDHRRRSLLALAALAVVALLVLGFTHIPHGVATPILGCVLLADPRAE